MLKIHPVGYVPTQDFTDDQWASMPVAVRNSYLDSLAEEELIADEECGYMMARESRRKQMLRDCE